MERTRRGLCQEALKLIAVVTMLLDHIGATLVPNIGLRVIGRVAFPIYCFLLAEGVHYTRDARAYLLRLGASMLVSELPFDLGLFGRVTLEYQSVMVTLTLACCMGLCMKRIDNTLLKALVAVPFALAAELLRTDYGGAGVLVVAMFLLTRGMRLRLAVQTALLAALCLLIGGAHIRIGAVRVPIELFGVLAMLPIACYRGAKASRSRAVQAAFYAFYPVHLSALYLIQALR